MKMIRQSMFWLRDVRHQPVVFLVSVWTLMLFLSWSLLTFTE
jgi:hypothetical protein